MAHRLRTLLDHGGSLEAIRDAARSGDPAATLPTPFFDHIGDVYRRLEIAADDDLVDLPALRLAVLVHEEPLDRLPALLLAAGFLDHAPTVLAVVTAFGKLWKIDDSSALAGYVDTHRRRLAAVLLFELAHEGRPIPAMGQAARQGGLGVDFARWAERLAATAPLRP